MNGKSHTLASFAVVREKLRSEGKILAAVSGSFDPLHDGHRRYLEAARKEGDALVLFLNSDRSVRAYKGPSRPYLTEQNRAAALAALPSVDFIITFDELTPIQTIASVRPDVYCNGADWGRDSVERPVVEAYGGKMVVIDLPRESSSALLTTMRPDAPADRRAVFLDRDGTLIEDCHYLGDPDGVKLLPGVPAALRSLGEAGFALVIVTNQSGVGRELFSEKDMHMVNERLLVHLAREGVRILGVYCCAHHPGDGCTCRKPEPGLLIEAAEEHGLTLNGSWMIGDSCSDVLAGRNVNVHTIKLGDASEPCSPVGPQAYARDLPDAARHILSLV